MNRARDARSRRPPVPSGCVFDLDGTLTDNMALHQRAFDVFAARHGLPPISMEQRRATDGKRNRDIFPILFARPLDDATLAAYAEEKESMYRELSRGRLVPTAGLRDLLERLASLGIPSAVATWAPAANVEHTLRELALDGAFAAIAKSDELPRGKPFPDVFLHAAAQLQADPRTCLAFEDAPIGIEAAKRAGMTSVALTTTSSVEIFRAHAPPPDHVVRDFREFLDGPGRELVAVRKG